MRLIETYSSDRFQNENLFLGQTTQRKWIDFQFNNNLKGLDQAIQLANQYDVVILHDLDYAKSYITNRIDADIPIMWRFFGYELYDKIKQSLYTEKTKGIQEKRPRLVLVKAFIQRRLLRGYSFRYKRVDMISELKKAKERINFFHCLSEEEHIQLKEHFELPKFIQIPYQIDVDLVYSEKQGNTIIIGNNRSAYNNHFEILDIVSKYPELKKFSFLSYGTKMQYYHKVMEQIEKIENFTPITTFLSLKEFEAHFDRADAFVLNGYRQMATGNIAAAFQYGVKLYLNKNNPYYHLLINNGFLVFEVGQLDDDIKNKNITLSKKEAEQNINALKNLNNLASIDEFVNDVEKIVSDFSSN